MNFALITAGGKGQRMTISSCPKQFMELDGKPIIVYTLEKFERHTDIDGIVIVCIKDWIPYLRRCLVKFGIKKVVDVVPGGQTGQESIYKGLVSIERHSENADTIVLVHDAVRPLINGKTISDNITEVKKEKNCITCSPAYETLLIKDENYLSLPHRDLLYIARAPQSFYLNDLINAHRKALKEHKVDFIDSCTLMDYFGYKLNLTIGPMENLKITSPVDFHVFKAIMEELKKDMI